MTSRAIPPPPRPSSRDALEPFAGFCAFILVVVLGFLVPRYLVQPSLDGQVTLTAMQVGQLVTAASTVTAAALYVLVQVASLIVLGWRIRHDRPSVPPGGGIRALGPPAGCLSARRR